MGDEDDLCPGGLGGAQRLDHIPRGTGVGHEQHDILFRHQAGRHHLHVAVARRAELVGDARKPGADVVGHQHAAALPQAEHLPCAVQQGHSLVHRLR